jgi:DNA-binding response OmpR family regulator
MISDVAKASRILVIDDDLVSVELVKRVLTHAGFHTVASTSDPTIASALMREVKPHVVILDLNMPEMDGFALLDALRDVATQIGCSIIMLTGESDQDVQVAALRLGASDFVTKPFVASVLVARIAGAAEMRELQRRLSDQNDRLQEAVAARTSRLQDALGVLTHAESELKRSLEHSERQSHARSEILSELAHGLRTPLTAICGFSDAMRRQQGGTLAPRFLEYSEAVHGAAAHMLHVVDGLLDLAAACSGEQLIDISEVNLGTLAAETVKILSLEAETAGIDLKLVVKPGLGEIRTDRTKLAQIVLNLAADALVLAPPRGQAMIEVGPAAQGGAYIKVAHVARGGDGPGLAQTRRYVDWLGGSLSVPPQPSSGTPLVVRLPAAAPTVLCASVLDEVGT